MLTETLSGKCPCCGYDKLLQRYGSIGYFQLDGCANCGFAYGTNHHDEQVFGMDALIPYAIHILACNESENEFNKSYESHMIELNKMDKERIRRMLFDWCEKQERSNDVDSTVFTYSDDDIKSHKRNKLEVFKVVNS